MKMNITRTNSFVRTEKLGEDYTDADQIIFERTYTDYGADNERRLYAIRVYLRRTYVAFNSVGYKTELGMIAEMVFDKNTNKLQNFIQGNTTMLMNNKGNCTYLMFDCEFQRLFKDFLRECHIYDGENIKSIYNRDFIIPDLERYAYDELEDVVNNLVGGSYEDLIIHDLPKDMYGLYLASNFEGRKDNSIHLMLYTEKDQDHIDLMMFKFNPDWSEIISTKEFTEEPFHKDIIKEVANNEIFLNDVKLAAKKAKYDKENGKDCSTYTLSYLVEDTNKEE